MVCVLAGKNPDSRPWKHQFSQRKPIPWSTVLPGEMDDMDQIPEKVILRPCKGPPPPWDSIWCPWATSTPSPLLPLLFCFTDHAELRYTADVPGRDRPFPKKGRMPKDQTLGWFHSWLNHCTQRALICDLLSPTGRSLMGVTCFCSVSLNTCGEDLVEDTESLVFKCTSCVRLESPMNIRDDRIKI